MGFFSIAILLMTAAVASAAVPVSLAGEWANLDPNTNGITRLQISNQRNEWKLRCWAVGDKKALDQGEASLALLGDFVVCPNCIEANRTNGRELLESKNDPVAKKVNPQPQMNYGFAHWDYKFKDTYLTLTKDNGRLVVDDYNVFKDGSGRNNYRLHYVFGKSK